MKPLSQLNARRQLSCSGVESGLLLGYSPWPQSIHQHPKSVGWVRGVIDTLDLNVWRDIWRRRKVIMMTPTRTPTAKSQTE
jgi:hypothetical protein